MTSALFVFGVIFTALGLLFLVMSFVASGIKRQGFTTAEIAFGIGLSTGILISGVSLLGVVALLK